MRNSWEFLWSERKLFRALELFSSSLQNSFFFTQIMRLNSPVHWSMVSALRWHIAGQVWWLRRHHSGPKRGGVKEVEKPPHRTVSPVQLCVGVSIYTSHQKHISYCTKLRVLGHDQHGSARRPKTEEGENGRTRPSAQRYSWINGWRGNLPYKFRYLQLQKITWSKHLFAFLSKGMTSPHWLCWKNHDWTVEEWPEYSDTKLWVKFWESHTYSDFPSDMMQADSIYDKDIAIAGRPQPINSYSIYIPSWRISEHFEWGRIMKYSETVFIHKAFASVWFMEALVVISWQWRLCRMVAGPSARALYFLTL